MHKDITIFVESFIISFILNWFFVKFKSQTFSDTIKGPQKFHSGQIPRIGGLAIFIAIFISNIVLFLINFSYTEKFFYLTLSTLPVFLGGLLEDITKKVSPKIRLLFAFISGILACILLNANLTRLDIPFIDSFLQNHPLISTLFTAFALAGVANAINIIDGFNGLASGITLIVFATYLVVALLVKDQFLAILDLTIIGAVLGFFVWNFPWGRIFLGDGGAYTLGFLAGLNGVLLVKNHPEVSAWFPLLLLIYPVWEVIFSILRRKFIQSKHPFEPDAIHLHTLIYRRITKHKFKHLPNNLQNSLTSIYLWVLQLIATIPALIFYHNRNLLVMFSLLFIALYTWIYFRIVKFKTPKFLKI